MNDAIELMAAKPPDGFGKQEWGHVIRIHYTMHGADYKIKTRTSGFRKTTYYRYLYEVQEWIAEYLKL